MLTAERHIMSTSETSTTKQIDELQRILDAVNELKQWMDDEDIVAKEAEELAGS